MLLCILRACKLLVYYSANKKTEEPFEVSSAQRAERPANVVVHHARLAHGSASLMFSGK